MVTGTGGTYATAALCGGACFSPGTGGAGMIGSSDLPPIAAPDAILAAPVPSKVKKDCGCNDAKNKLLAQMKLDKQV